MLDRDERYMYRRLRAVGVSGEEIIRNKDKGYQIHGTIVLMPHENDTYTGLLCIQTVSPCVAVKGSDVYSYVRLYIGSPVELVLRGTYIFSSEHIARGQFYDSIKGNDDRGYWLMHRTNSDD